MIEAVQQLEAIRKAIHYPECWDTAVYPTLLHAVCEAFQCAADECEHPEQPKDHKTFDFIEQTKPAPLTFRMLSETNVLRCRQGFGKEVKDWSSAQWACAAGGELGELQNLIKKEFRGDRIPELDKKIGKEIADTVIYLDLLATSRGLDLGALVREKFNEVSRRVNSKYFI